MLIDIKQLSEKLEQISQIYAEKFDIERDAAWFLLKLQEEVGELTQSFLMHTGKARAKGKSPAEIETEFRKEIADVFCHTLLLARFYDVDLEKEVQEKWLWDYNPHSENSTSLPEATN